MIDGCYLASNNMALSGGGGLALQDGSGSLSVRGSVFDMGETPRYWFVDQVGVGCTSPPTRVTRSAVARLLRACPCVLDRLLVCPCVLYWSLVSCVLYCALLVACVSVCLLVCFLVCRAGLV